MHSWGQRRRTPKKRGMVVSCWPLAAARASRWAVGAGLSWQAGHWLSVASTRPPAHAQPLWCPAAPRSASQQRAEELSEAASRRRCWPDGRRELGSWPDHRTELLEDGRSGGRDLEPGTAGGCRGGAGTVGAVRGPAVAGGARGEPSAFGGVRPSRAGRRRRHSTRREPLG